MEIILTWQGEVKDKSLSTFILPEFNKQGEYFTLSFYHRISEREREREIVSLKNGWKSVQVSCKLS